MAFDLYKQPLGLRFAKALASASGVEAKAMKSSKVMPCTSCPGRCFSPVAAAATNTELFASREPFASLSRPRPCRKQAFRP